MYKKPKPHNLEVSYKPTPYLMNAIAKAEKELAEGKYKVAHSVDELERELRS